MKCSVFVQFLKFNPMIINYITKQFIETKICSFCQVQSVCLCINTKLQNPILHRLTVNPECTLLLKIMNSCIE